MSRRRCCGLVEEIPYSKRFVPEDKTDSTVAELYIEEVEAMRLKDIEGLDQQLCAAAMGISRATFQRILQRARCKVASALVYGQTIVITGGNYMVKNRIFECLDCHHSWSAQPCVNGGQHGYEISCPGCGSMKKMKLSDDGSKHTCDRRGHNGES